MNIWWRFYAPVNNWHEACRFSSQSRVDLSNYSWRILGGIGIRFFCNALKVWEYAHQTRLNVVAYTMLLPEGLLKDNPRLFREFLTVSSMIELYCKHHHQHPTLCNDCLTLMALCKHAYEAHLQTKRFKAEQQRQQIREVIKWAGPRLFFKHPLLTCYFFIRRLLK